MLWTKQYYYFDVDRWLKEHDAHPLFGTGHRAPRNAEWFHMLNGDIISMPDKWEYPWYAAWDLAFHTIALSLVDFDFAKDQLLLMLRTLYSHPNGQIPAYEWNFSDVNPPVHAWATLFLYRVETNLGREDLEFLERSFQGLMLNFNWWVNRKDPQGRNVFAGGFLGLDNIGVFDRSAQLPTGGITRAGRRHGVDGVLLPEHAGDGAHPGRARQEVRGDRLQVPRALHLDRLRDGQGRRARRRHVGRGGRLLLRRAAAARRRGVPAEGAVDGRTAAALRQHGDRAGDGAEPSQAARARSPSSASAIRRWSPRWRRRRRASSGVAGRRLLSPLSKEKLTRILGYLLDENEFLGPHGIRSLSKYHEKHPFVFHTGGQEYQVQYLPAESNNGMFGGNSNWRGPVWMPVNGLIVRGLLNFYSFYGDDFTVECPTGSGNHMTLFEVAKEISRRLTGIFVRDANGRRPVYGGCEKFQNDPHWRDYILFYEYFHGDNGAGLGASHQTGWTGIVARLMDLFGRMDAGGHADDRKGTAGRAPGP